MTNITLDQVRRRAEADARTFGYNLTPDPELLQMFLEGLKANEERYGYPSCPCRLASGKFDFDRDIICPCDYRDPDIQEYGSCYCRLYVNKEVYDSKRLPEVPERRPMAKQAKSYEAAAETASPTNITKEVPVGAPKAKLWYCKQCGYVVYRDEPPYVCPICKAKKEIFAELKSQIDFLG